MGGAQSTVRRVGRLAILALLGLAIAGELTARFYLGLGDPPLFVSDPEIEYLNKPAMTYQRFGNRLVYNAYSMRCDDFPKHKSDPTQLRVLVLGDSVISGGSLTDQSQLATELLQARLLLELNRSVVVGNISAGSWGPGNLLAYVKRFGWFEADIVVIVLSSHDYADHPTFKPVVGRHPSMPDHTPFLALGEVFTRYSSRLRVWENPKRPQAPLSKPVSQESIDDSTASLRELIRLAKATGANVLVAQHLETSELSGSQTPGHEAIQRIALEQGVQVVQLGPAMARCKAAGQNPYRDTIHPNAKGQEVIATVLHDAILAGFSTILDPRAR